MDKELDGNDLFESDKKRRYLIEVIERINLSKWMKQK